MTHRINDILWRVIFTDGSLRSSATTVRGPWHPNRQRTEAWSNWLRDRGQATLVQSSNGDVYDRDRLVQTNAPL